MARVRAHTAAPLSSTGAARTTRRAVRVAREEIAPKTGGDTFRTAAASDPSTPLRPASAAVTFIESFESGLKLSPEARAQRAAFMKQSPENFFRANPGLFHQDLRQAYDVELLGRPAPQVLIGGDTHLGNFGVLRGPKGRGVFTLNDYDQAGHGSPEADLQRLATGAVLAARAQGLSVAEQQKLARSVGDAWLAGVNAKGPGYLDASDGHGIVKQLVKQGDSQTRRVLLDKWTEGDAKLRTLDDLEPLKGREAQKVKAAVEAWAGAATEAPIARPVQVLDVARKLGSGGSTLGLDRYYALVAGREGKKPRLIELKAFPPAAVEGSSPDLSKAEPRKVVSRASALAGFTSPLLGEATLDGQKLLVREVEPERVRLEVDKLTASQLTDVARQAATTLARAHGHRDELLAWVGRDGARLSDQLAAFAMRYANQVKADFVAFGAA